MTQSEAVLDRLDAVPRLLGRHEDFLIIAGLAGTARDTVALSRDGAHVFALAGAMGASVSMGLGLALSRPDKRVLVVTGDGEMLMNVGSLSTVSVANPKNFGVLCVDNGHYGETGYQKSHTSLGVDLEQNAIGSGFKSTMTVDRDEQIDAGARMIRDANAPYFVLLRVKPTDPPRLKRLMDPAECRVRFRRNLLNPT